MKTERKLCFMCKLMVCVHRTVLPVEFNSLCGWWEKPSLLLQVMQTLFSSLQAVQVRHHLLHMILRVAVLDVGKPAATHADDY